MPVPKPDLFFKNAAGRWRRRAQSAADAPLKIFSPYITGKQALHLSAGRENAEVYTLFEAELFMSGASALVELRALLKAQVAVYQLPGLHAKIVWIPGTFLSIGSQNLTSRGKRNKEATATVSHQPWMDHVESALEHWIQERELITLEMVEDMERAIIPLRREFQKTRVKLIAVNKLVESAEATRRRLREEEEKRKRRREVQRRDRGSLFEQSFRRLRASAEMTAVVREFNTGRVSLVAAPGYSFLRWVIDGEAVDLQELKRYLCVVPELGRLGWARVSNGLISYVESGVRRESTTFLGKKCTVKWNATERLGAHDHNLTFEVIGHSELQSPTFKLWLDADHVELIEREDVNKDVLGRWEEIAPEIVRHLTRPFKYGQRLTGKKADRFLYANVGSEFRVRLARLAGHVILVAEAVSRP